VLFAGVLLEFMELLLVWLVLVKLVMASTPAAPANTTTAISIKATFRLNKITYLYFFYLLSFFE
jgi:hypothetical protein